MTLLLVSLVMASVGPVLAEPPLEQLRGSSHVAQESTPSYMKRPVNTKGCEDPFDRVADEASCRKAAASLELNFGFGGSDGGAPEGCYYVAGDGHRPSSVNWNTLGEKTWENLGSVCELPGFIGGFTKMGLKSNGCSAGFYRVENEAKCKTAASWYRSTFQGSREDGGAPKGCYFQWDPESKTDTIGWNTRGDVAWPDAASVCVYSR